MSHFTISPAIRVLYARQRTLLDQVHLSEAERAELIALDSDIGKAWDAERAARCRALHGAPRTIVTGPDPRDQAYGG
jgi:hypothetical protein